jgi:CDP-diacylglycerol--serine O-phosphatidyltransferase
LGFIALAIVLLISFPWEMLTIVVATYIILLPFGIRSYRKTKADFESRQSRESAASAP